jgi:hypothetical protein
LGRVAHIGEKRNAYIIQVGKLEGKKPLVRPRCRWEDSIRTGVEEVVWKCVDWSDLMNAGMSRQFS